MEDNKENRGDVSNKRLYVDANSSLSYIFEKELEDNGLLFYRHEAGMTWTQNTTVMMQPSIVYTFYEKDFKKAQQLLDETKRKIADGEVVVEHDELDDEQIVAECPDVPAPAGSHTMLILSIIVFVALMAVLYFAS